ncbi:hypothetical protein [Embleya hyalina]|uniref:Uncharacterized protein n=1 Tax=Embleya hyalina TaxID=516124 RepID=A0A401YJD4_9ACTN|nr:hypothetical protein [Embleya hyalina]GCD94701.1 hypothetical protein EHYA_02370 [Embleya hyalina]
MSEAIAVFGIGCHTACSDNLDIEVLQAPHGRTPSPAAGAPIGWFVDTAAAPACLANTHAAPEGTTTWPT